MKFLNFVTVLFAVVFASFQNVLAESALVTRTPVVQLADGKVRGIVRDVNGHSRSVHFYQGIRYGHAKRFAKPTSVEPWSGVYEADSYREACPHFGEILFGASTERTKTQSEDCLYLNVWQPVIDGEKQHNRPVMVWIHGGGFQFGSIFEQFPDLSYWADKGDVVMVEISYRLGAFGFLVGPGVPPNLAIYDQMLGLKWVQHNIHHFGGDPKKVTIFGESAGSMSVGMMILSPLSSGLFHRAIMQSGAPTAEPAFMRSQSVSELKTKRFASHLNCTSTLDKMDDIVTCLRNKSTAEFQKASLKIYKDEPFLFMPSYGNEVLPENPVEMLKSGNFNRVDLLFGVCKDEGTMFAAMNLPELIPANTTLTLQDAQKAMTKLVNQYGPTSYAQEVVDFYMQKLSSNSSQSEIKTTISAIVGEHNLVCPTILFAEEYARHSQANHFYSYRFMEPAPDGIQPIIKSWAGVEHGAEVPFEFMTPNTKATEAQHQLHQDIFRSWTSFAKSGNPGKIGSQAIQWKSAFDVKHNDYTTNSLLMRADSYQMEKGTYSQNCDKLWKNKLFF